MDAPLRSDAADLLAGTAALAGQAGGSTESRRAAGAALTGLTACPTLAACPAVPACSAVPTCSAAPTCAVAAGGGIDNGTEVDEAADCIEGGVGVDGWRGGQRGHRRSQKCTGCRTQTDQLTTPAYFGVIRPAIPLDKALTSH
jgi:hypothetical protein